MAREGKMIGASLDAEVMLHSTDETKMRIFRKLWQSKNSVDELRRAFIVSDVTVTSDVLKVRECSFVNLGDNGREDMTVGVRKASGVKCDRCWHYSMNVGESSSHKLLCDRCVEAVKRMGILEAPAMPQKVA